MKHLIHLIDDSKFKFIPDLGEIGHFEIVDQRSKSKEVLKNE
jgi:hypothetical protein